MAGLGQLSGNRAGDHPGTDYCNIRFSRHLSPKYPVEPKIGMS